MDKAQALHSFFSSFGWNAFEENTVPDFFYDLNGNRVKNEMPYITYEVSTNKMGNAVYISASLWDRSSSWESTEEKKNEIARELDWGGSTFKFDDGVMWVEMGDPFSQHVGDEDPGVRRILLNFAVEFLSAA